MTMNDDLVDVLTLLTRAITRLGLADADTSLGAIEALAVSVHDGCERIAIALDGVAMTLAEMHDAHIH